MRQETIIKTYLKFTELSADQQKKVIDKQRDINIDHDWSEWIIEEFTARLKRLGFYDIKTQWSGFWSQGDGASFTAKHKRGDVYRIGHHYAHSNTITSDCECIKLVARRLSNKLYKLLDKEYEYRTSDAAIKETIKANDYEFDSETLVIV